MLYGGDRSGHDADLPAGFSDADTGFVGTVTGGAGTSHRTSGGAAVWSIDRGSRSTPWSRRYFRSESHESGKYLDRASGTCNDSGKTAGTSRHVDRDGTGTLCERLSDVIQTEDIEVL